MNDSTDRILDMVNTVRKNNLNLSVTSSTEHLISGLCDIIVELVEVIDEHVKETTICGVPIHNTSDL